MEQSPKSVVALEATKENRALKLEDLPRTHVFPSLLSMNWDMVQNRCQKYQTEASQWVLKRTPNNQLKWLRLPIHQACICDPSTAVLTSLMDAYPKGVCETDHQKRLPIHLACIHGASTYVVFMLLTAFPDSVYERDEWGKYPMDYVSSSKNDNKAELEKLFRQGAHAYEFSASEKIKVQELKNAFGHRLVEASNGDSVEQKKCPNYQEEVELELEVVEEEIPAEVLMSRSIIRGLEEQLEASLKVSNENKARAENAEKARGLLEQKMKGFKEDRVSELERELVVVSTRNSNMRYAFEKLEKAVIVLENGAKGKEEKLQEAYAKIASLEAERDEQRLKMEAVEEQEKIISDLTEKNAESEKKICDLEAERNEQRLTIEAMEEQAKVISDLTEKNAESEKKICDLEESIEYVKNGREEILSMKEHLTETSEMANELEKATNEIQELNANIITIAEKNTSLAKEIGKLKAEKIRLTTSLESFRTYQYDAEKRMDFLEEELSSLEERNAKLTSIIRQFRVTSQVEHMRSVELALAQLSEAEEYGDVHNGIIDDFSDI